MAAVCATLRDSPPASAPADSSQWVRPEVSVLEKPSTTTSPAPTSGVLRPQDHKSNVKLERICTLMYQASKFEWPAHDKIGGNSHGTDDEAVPLVHDILTVPLRFSWDDLKPNVGPRTRRWAHEKILTAYERQALGLLRRRTCAHWSGTDIPGGGLFGRPMAKAEDDAEAQLRILDGATYILTNPEWFAVYEKYVLSQMENKKWFSGSSSKGVVQGEKRGRVLVQICGR
ncbi:hypothetical protein QBC47DRAFT_407809 [Echria macrotheca]|uniref:Uncharacterized protein n=1 Tax=Echria macrotheca TaxID=438768 RepID=A0AAJ0B3P7_9PEZI|nr:hypothetical protein QBC47DRAFT_407809 [Echria macrotheca]